MALILVSVLISAIPLTYCFPAAFQDLGGLHSEYRLLLLPLIHFVVSSRARTSLELCLSLLVSFPFYLPENRTSLKFLAVGDWGGVPYPPYITAVQKATAHEMSKVAEQMGADFVLALGDNFYYTGVESVDSPRFKVSQTEVSLILKKRMRPSARGRSGKIQSFRKLKYRCYTNVKYLINKCKIKCVVLKAFST